jgi:pimeloyl-ACP methyl ester carboxylesterase
MARARICLIHGAATTARIWRDVAAALPSDVDVLCPDRPGSGNLDREIDALTPLCTGAIVLGVSGGATLVLELAARGVPFWAGIAHEPAVGSLVPDLLAPMITAYADGGVAAFGATLYGPMWSLEMAPADPEAVGRDLAMFRGFEPRPPAPGSGDVLVTVGERSPAIRHEAARRLHERLGLPSRIIAGSGHAAHLEQPAALARLILEHLVDPGVTRATRRRRDN